MSQGLEIWVQPGIPEDNELVFNVHFRIAEGTEWEVSRVQSVSHASQSVSLLFDSGHTHIYIATHNSEIHISFSLWWLVCLGFISFIAVWQFRCGD